MSYIPKEGDYVVHGWWGFGKVVTHPTNRDVMTVVFDKQDQQLHSGSRGRGYYNRCWNFPKFSARKDLAPATLENV